jgi:RNA polymerase sigma-70 factor (ECF subfamily)
VDEFRPAHVIEADAALARAVTDGDEDAIRELVDRYGGLVYTVALRIVGDRQRAEDVAQHTFLQAWRNADRFEPGRDFAPWLATIARRAAIDALRKEQRRPTARLDDEAMAVSDPRDIPDAAQIELIWDVRAAIDLLDDDQREVVRLRYLEGLTQREIAARLGVPLGTVKSRLARAGRRLASRLGRYGDRAEADDGNRQTEPDVGRDGDE